MIILTQEPFDTNYEKGTDKVKYRDAIAYKNKKELENTLRRVVIETKNFNYICLHKIVYFIDEWVWRGDVSVLEMILSRLRTKALTT